MNNFLPIVFLLAILFSCQSQDANNTNASKEAEPFDVVKKGATLQLLADDFEFTEGPAMDPNGNIYFTDQPNDKIWKWDWATNQLSVFMDKTGRANGLYFDHDGNLLSCSDEGFAILRISPDKEIQQLTSSFEGKNFNGPNDLWVDPAGGIYFTDPYYQRPWWTRQEKEIPEERVYYLGPKMTDPIMIADGFVQPNGIIGSADGKTLYIADIGDKKTYQFDVTGPGKLTNKKLFCELGSDGMTLDNLGNVYLTGKGVTVFNKDGKKIKQIDNDKNWTANVTFGGKDQSTLFITAQTAVYTLEMNVHGVR